MIGYSSGRAIKDEQDEQRLFRRRAWSGFIIIALLLLVLLSRYIWLQIFAFDSFSTRSESNRVSVRPVTPNRGIIYDRRGRIIAENRPAYRLEIVAENVAGKAEGLETLLDALSGIIDLNADNIARFH